MKKEFFLILCFFYMVMYSVQAQQKAKPEDTEFYSPVPKLVTPGKAKGDAPSDAIVLFNGENLSQWVSANDSTKPAKWEVTEGIITVNKKAGDIQTRQSFMDHQFHIEWRIPEIIAGKGQARGNSGLFLASPEDDTGYELQILDSYNSSTYVNGQAGSIYKQYPPLVNANLPPGVWQTYDVIWTAPRFNDDGSIKTPARATVLFNGILIQNNVELKGGTPYIGPPSYKKHGPAPIRLQAHGDPSEPISFRNIWIRPL
ncbi:MAG: DUF1080 domain-containing protein [Chitinophagaceae bacterium]|nr:DUF1080 domain-containing protein [Chitinophagaceae bacterium]